MYRSKKNNGFSLVELIVSMAVLLIVSVAVSVVASRMLDASATQRRRANQHVYEERARHALLSVLRDARISDRVWSVAPGEIVLVASRPGIDEPIRVRYALNAENILTREVHIGSFDPPPPAIPTQFNPGAEVPVGDGLNAWPNPFVPTVVDEFNPAPYDGTDTSRLSVEIVLDLPILPGDRTWLCVACDPDPCTCAPDGYRRWVVNSAVTVDRMPF